MPWFVLAGAVVMQIATAPGQTVGVSVFVGHFSDDLNLSRSAISTAYLIGTLAGAITMPAAGRLVDSRGLRFATLGFAGAFGAVLIAMSSVVGFVTLAAGFAFTRALGQGALTLTATTTVAVWFDERRGLATGIMTAIGGGLMALVPLVSTVLIAAVGWRATWVLLGLGVWALVVPIGALLIRDPRSSAATVQGATDLTTVVAPIADTTAVEAPTGPSWPVADVVRHPAFWAMNLASALAALVGTGLLFHHVDLMTGRGLTETQAAAAFVPLTVASAIGALVAGRYADRVSPRLLTAMALVLLAGSALLVGVVDGVVTAATYGGVLGVAITSIRTIEATALPRWFGVSTIGQIRGLVMAGAVGASALGPLALSLGLDAFGSYTPILVILAAISVVLAAATLLVDPPPVSGVPRRGQS
jgi:MFS family permease